MLQVNGEKMSKSLGNFFTVRDVLAKAEGGGETIRFLLLRTHYRSLLDFSDQGLLEAKRELDRFYRALEQVPDVVAGDIPPPVLEALCDDLNTPLAISAMHGLARTAMTGDRDAAAGLRAAGTVLGLLQRDPNAWAGRYSFTLTDHVATSDSFDIVKPAGDDADIDAAIAERLAARKARDFARADAIRAEWAAKGIVFEDRPDGTTSWRRAERQLAGATMKGAGEVRADAETKPRK
jgi:cysteinyl-tRNA synthetase